MTTEMIVTCACGLEMRGPREELVRTVQQHGRDMHNMDVTEAQVVAMATPADAPASRDGQ